MPSIRIKGLDREIEVDAGADLRRACMDNHVNLFFGPWAKAFNCRGKGLCNLCKVEVLEGSDQLTPRTKREQKRLKNKPDTWRLACCAKVQGDIAIDSFPVRHAEDRVPPEALHRATLDPEALKELEREDWVALRDDGPVKEKGPKKGLLAKVRRKKGIDDSDDHAPGAPLEEGEAAAAEDKPQRGFFGKGKKKDADADAQAAGDGKIKVKKAKKDKKDKKGKKDNKDEPKGKDTNGTATKPQPETLAENEEATDAGVSTETNGDAKKKPVGKRFGVKARKK